MKASRVPALVSVLFDDFRQHLVLVLLFLMAITSALAVIYVSHGHRLLTIERDELLSERDALDIERIAEQRLNMVRAEAEQEVLVPWQ